MSKVTTLVPKPATKASAARFQARELVTGLLDVERQRARWASEWQGWTKRSLISESAWKDPEPHRATAQRQSKSLPSFKDVRSAMETFWDACNKPCGEKELDLLLAVMVDGFPNARPKNMASYLDALALTIGEFNVKRGHGDFSNKASVHGVAAAVKDIWSEMEFAPSPKEFLDACKEAGTRFERCWELCHGLEEGRSNAEAVLIVLGEMQHYSDFDPDEDECEDFAEELRGSYARHLAEVEQERLKREAAEQERKAEEERRKLEEEAKLFPLRVPVLRDRVQGEYSIPVEEPRFGTVTGTRPADFEADVVEVTVQLDSGDNGSVSVSVKDGVMIHRGWHERPSCWNLFRLRPGEPGFEIAALVPARDEPEPDPAEVAGQVAPQGGAVND